MVMNSDSHAHQPDPAAYPHHAVRELLAEYATASALGSAPERIYPHIATHLGQCPACRAELEELLELTVSAFMGKVEAAPRYPRVDLSFLGLAPPAPLTPGRPWRITPLGQLVITFSEALITALQQPALAGAPRGQLLYRYIQEPQTVQDLNLTIEVFAEDVTQKLGRVQVVVEVPSRDPFDQAGSHVVLRAGDTTQEGETDESGYVDFAPVPLDAIPQLRVEVTPHRSDAP